MDKISLTLFVILLIATLTDLKYREIPNGLTFPSICIGLIIGYPSNKEKLLGLILLFLFGMTNLLGMGDLKLLMVIHAFLGFLPSIYILGISALCLIIYVCLTKKDAFYSIKLTLKQISLKQFQIFEQESYPFAPFLFLGTLIYRVVMF